MVRQRDEFLQEKYFHELDYRALLIQPELEIKNLAAHLEIDLDRDTLKLAEKSIKPSWIGFLRGRTLSQDFGA